MPESISAFMAFAWEMINFVSMRSAMTSLASAHTTAANMPVSPAAWHQAELVSQKVPKPCPDNSLSNKHDQDTIPAWSSPGVVATKAGTSAERVPSVQMPRAAKDKPSRTSCKLQVPESPPVLSAAVLRHHTESLEGHIAATTGAGEKHEARPDVAVRASSVSVSTRGYRHVSCSQQGALQPGEDSESIVDVALVAPQPEASSSIMASHRGEKRKDHNSEPPASSVHFAPKQVSQDAGSSRRDTRTGSRHDNNGSSASAASSRQQASAHQSRCFLLPLLKQCQTQAVWPLPKACCRARARVCTSPASSTGKGTSKPSFGKASMC